MNCSLSSPLIFYIIMIIAIQEKYSENLCWLESTHYIIDPLDQADAVINEGFLNSPIYKTTGPKSG